MSQTSKLLLIGAGVAAFAGAVLTFAVADSSGGLDVEALGLVLLGGAAIAVIAVAMATVAPSADNDEEGGSVELMRIVTGLVAVVAGIIAVVALTLVTVTLLPVSENGEATVAITTAAFGIVSTVVTAYLGIKATANTSSRVASAAAEVAESLADTWTEEGPIASQNPTGRKAAAVTRKKGVKRAKRSPRRRPSDSGE
jgi:hypothetical protein